MKFDDNKNLMIDFEFPVDGTTKGEILDKKYYKFKKNTILFGDYNHDISMSYSMG